MSNICELMVKDLPVVFISYFEPNESLNFFSLKTTWAPSILLTVAGVKGHDAAHKKAAALAREACPEVENFVTIDGDTQVTSSSFWNLWLSDIQRAARVEDLTKSVVSFRSLNAVNAAQYGNGGIKIWSQDFIQKMRTHENSVGETVVDFCWDPNYVQMANLVGTTFPNGSALQAFRAGYREAVKLTLANKSSVSETDLVHSRLHEVSETRINQWATLGADVKFGIWAQLGTMKGLVDVFDGQEVAVSSLVDYDLFWSVFEQFLSNYDLQDCVNEEFADNQITSVVSSIAATLLSIHRIKVAPFTKSRSALIRQFLMQSIDWDAPLKRE